MRARESSHFLLSAGLAIAAIACRTEAAPPPPPPPTVEVVKVLQRDVPLQSEWLATLDGYVNADIKPQVSGYLVRQLYTEGAQVKKGDVLFEIDPRPFRAALDQASAQLDQSRAQLGKAEQDVVRNRPLAEARAIARSQLDNDIQAERAAKAASASAGASQRQARLNLEFTKVRSLVNGIAGIARGQIGDLVGSTTVLTTVSQVDPIKAYLSISEQEYLRFAENMVAGGQLMPGGGPPGQGDGGGLELVLGDGKVHAYKGQFAARRSPGRPHHRDDPRAGHVPQPGPAAAPRTVRPRARHHQRRPRRAAHPAARGHRAAGDLSGRGGRR